MKLVGFLLFSIFSLFALPGLAQSQWVKTGLASTQVQALGTSGNNVLASTYQGVFYSSDEGQTWLESQGVPLNTLITTYAENDSFLFCAGAGFFRSSDHGVAWMKVDKDSSLIRRVQCILADGAMLYVGTEGAGIFRSSDDGATWGSVGSELSGTNVLALAKNGKRFYASIVGGIYRSSDDGEQWSLINYGWKSDAALSLTTIDSSGLLPIIYAGTGTGLFRTTATDSVWKYFDGDLSNQTIRSFLVTGTRVLDPVLIAGTDFAIRASMDFGAHWRWIGDGLPSMPKVTSLVASNNYAASATIYAAINSYGVWKRQVSSFPQSSVQPLKVSTLFLAPNFPNPFNPSTVITYTLPQRSMVTLEVFDMLGRRVQTLANETLPEGEHTARFDASGLVSGVYSAVLSANGERREIRMVLGK